MTCQTCGADNRAGAKFCSECGTPQARACSGCGSAITASDKFCSECGTPTTAAPTPSPVPGAKPEERRFVTALFVDLVGFTPLTEARDSEEVRRMLTVYFDRAREIVERFGGVIDKYIGDAVMAVWGAHQAHEDDAERAVRAALELVDAVEQVGVELNLPGLRARAGVLSGEAVVGGDGNAVTGLIVGDTVNTASRLQSAAQPGTVLVGKSTRDLAAKAVEFEDLGLLDLKGKAGATGAWRAVRVSGGVGGIRRAGGLVPPFVGRADELRVLKDNLHAAQRDGRLRMVSIVGQGGIGKSRLVDELWGYVDGLNDVVYWHHGRSLAYGAHAGFWAIGEMVRQRCGITEGDDEHKTRTRLRTALTEIVNDNDDREWMEPKLENLLGISDAAAERTELFAAWRMFFTSIAGDGPVVMVFEDLHWADDGMLEFVDDLCRAAVEHPILVVTLARPSLLETRAGWGSGRANSVSLHLAPLAPTTMRDLLLGVLPDAPPTLLSQLVERSGGIPLYAVEMIRMLIDRGLVDEAGDRHAMAGEVDTVEIPDSLHGLVGARLDQFDEPVRALIADAAILGQSFRVEGLEALRDESVDSLLPKLDDLVRKEVFSLNRDPRSPERGQYQFVQSIIREVAHDRVSRSDRLRAHQRVAAFYESLNEPELTGIIASHYLDALEAAGESAPAGLAAKAVESLLAAADRADVLGSHPQVVSLCLRGVELTEDPSVRGELFARGAQAAHSALDDRARDMATQAMDEFDRSDDHLGRIRAAAVYAKLLDDVGESHEAWPPLLAALEAHPGETETHARAMAELARAFMLDGHPDVFEWTEGALAVAEKLDMIPTIAELWATKGAGLVNAGRLREANVILQASLAVAREHQLSRTKRRAMANLNYASDLGFDPFIEERVEDARRLGDQRLLAEALLGRLWEATFHLDWTAFDEAVAELERLPAVDAQMADAIEEQQSERHKLCGDPVAAALAAEARWVRQGPGDQQTEVNRVISRAEHRLYAGDHADAFELAVGAEHRSPNMVHLNWAMVAAMRLRDRERLSRVLEAGRGAPKSRVNQLRHLGLEGAIAALDGELGDAEAGFGGAIELADELWGPIYGGFLRAESLAYLGGGNERAKRWAGEIVERWQAAGARTLLDTYDDVVGMLSDRVAETA